MMPVDLLFDRRGHLWVGSREGLYRYDGYRATLFAPDSDDPHAITDLDIRALYEDRDGIIWVATNTGGLNRFDPKTRLFTNYRHRPDDAGSISHDSVYGLAEGPSGDLWFGSQIGLNRMDRNTGTITRYLHDPSDPQSLPGNYVYTVHLDRDSVLWVATIGGGLARYDTVSDSFTKFDLAAMTGGDTDENDVFALGEDDKGRLWVGTRSGLVRLNQARTSAELIDLSDSGAIQPVITAMEVAADDALWLGTISHGLIRLDLVTGKWLAYTDYSDKDPGGLASQPQLSIATHANLVFVGTWGAGLWAARIPNADFGFYGVEKPATGLRFANITSLLAGETPGTAWVGSFGGGLQKLDVSGGRFFTLPNEPADLASIGVLAITRMSDGRLFAATTSSVLAFSPDGELLRRYVHTPGDPGSIGEGYVSALLADGEDLWVGVGGSGLFRLRPGEDDFEAFRHNVAEPESLSGDYITALLEDGGTHLWVGTRSNGLNLCEKTSMRCASFRSSPDASPRLGHFHVTDLHRDARGRVWVATDGGGLHQVERGIDGRVSGFRRWTQRDGLISDGVMAIAEDSDGSLWLSTRHGLTRLDPGQGRVANYVEQSGLDATHFNAGSADSDNAFIYFGSADGVVTIPLGRPFAARAPSQVRITAIETIGAEQRRASGGWVPDVVTADYREMLDINFAVLDYAEVPHEYEFRLDDGSDWTPLRQRTDVTFLNLAPGSYRFVARGRDVFGLWSESNPVRIDVIPPFWMSNGFRLLLFAAAVGFVLAFHNLRTRRLRKLALEVERLAALREQALEEALGDRSELSGLTPRQKEVLQLIAEGCSTREIAERLDVSVKTVETHRAHLMDRLDIRDVPGLVRLAIRARLISPHD